ncbi:hypothetical protein J6590_075104 [Homalodisca vitripennis]|nr:hypothetical protein J6590_075104 [Homalodisca vitripennis]
MEIWQLRVEVRVGLGSGFPACVRACVNVCVCGLVASATIIARRCPAAQPDCRGCGRAGVSPVHNLQCDRYL